MPPHDHLRGSLKGPVKTALRIVAKGPTLRQWQVGVGVEDGLDSLRPERVCGFWVDSYVADNPY